MGPEVGVWTTSPLLPTSAERLIPEFASPGFNHSRAVLPGFALGLGNRQALALGGELPVCREAVGGFAEEAESWC